jgi:hypothetical protein
MFTLVDFTTYIKGVEYVLAVLAIGGFLLFWEVLKPKPFKSVVESGKDDLDYIEQRGGFRHVLKTVGKIAAAPFIGLAYIVMLPIGFFALLTTTLVNAAVNGTATLIGRNATFEWRPMEAYFTGKKNREKTVTDDNKDEI